MKNPHFLVLFFFISQFCFSQSEQKLDSLFAKETNDSVKVSILNKLAFKFIFNNQPKARNVIKKSEVIAISKNLKFGFNEIQNIKGIINDVSGQSDSAFFYFTKSLKLSKLNNFKTLEVRSLNNIGMYYFNVQKNNEALKYFLETQKTNEELPTEKQINASIYLNNIGLIYQSLRLYKKAIPFHEKALKIRIDKSMLKDQATSYSNLGICYRNLGLFNEAVSNFEKGSILAKQTENVVLYFTINRNLANVYIDKKQFDKPIKLLLESLNAPKEIITTLEDKLSDYSKLGLCYVGIGKPETAKTYAEKGLDLLNKNPKLEPIALDLYQALGASNYALGNIEIGEKYIIKYFDLSNQIFSEKNAGAVASLEVKYATAKKDKLLAENKLLIIKNQVQVKQKTNQLIIASILALAFLIIGYLVYRQQKQKNQQQAQENQLKSAIAEIENQNKLQEQRLSISRDLHDNIGAQLTFIISSVDNVKYGFDITNKKLDDKLTNISGFAKDTIVELRDTIWAMNSNEISFEDLESRINNYIEKAKVAQDNISFSFAIDPDLKSQKLTSVEGMNIYRTIQEAVNNSLKYANADIITINAKKVEKQIKITIADNGKGFDIDEIEKGNGLNNMKKRIEEIGGKFALTSGVDGTKIVVLI